MPNQIKRLFAFDFDDTLAITSSIIGVRRTMLDGKSDPDFINWLREQGVNFYEIEKEKTDSELFWFESVDFAKYEQAHKQDLEYLTLNNVTDEYDFSKSYKVEIYEILYFTLISSLKPL